MEIKALSMTDQLRMIKPIEPLIPKNKGSGAVESETHRPSFGDVLLDKINEVNTLGIDADAKIKSAIVGDNANPHETLIAVQKAETSFQILQTMTDKIIQAYQTITRMPLG